jgi:hypothetical protein
MLVIIIGKLLIIINLWILLGFIGTIGILVSLYKNKKYENVIAFKKYRATFICGPLMIPLLFYYLWKNRPKAIEQREKTKEERRKEILKNMKIGE